MSHAYTFIAEVKTISPFGWRSDRSWEELFELATTYGDMISIHTDARWGGSFELLKRARQRTNKPLLAKGLHESDELVAQALEVGADWVLVVGRVPGANLERCLVEPLSLQQLGEVPAAVKVVWNSRDLSTGGAKNDSFKAARKQRVGWMCQASHIRTIADIDTGADAVLVGSHLPEFIGSLAKP